MTLLGRVHQVGPGKAGAKGSDGVYHVTDVTPAHAIAAEMV